MTTELTAGCQGILPPLVKYTAGEIWGIFLFFFDYPDDLEAQYQRPL